MNILGHLFLSGDSAKRLLAGFIINTVNYKKIFTRYSFPLEEIGFHSALDEFSYAHPSYRNSLSRISMVSEKNKIRLTDLFYDHFLATEWKNYSNCSLEEFQREKLSAVYDQVDALPPRSRMILMYFLSSEGFSQLASIKGLHSYASGSSLYVSDPSFLKIVSGFTENYNLFKKDFKSFFPDLIQHSINIRNREIQRNLT